MNRKSLPSLFDAPLPIIATESHCALITAWVVIRCFGLQTSRRRIMRSCHHSVREGVFSIALACALREHGLDVQFHTETDPSPSPIEMRLYARAARLGIPILSAISIQNLLDHAQSDHVPIVLFQRPREGAHFAILVGSTRAYLTFHDQPRMTPSTFERAWTHPGIFRQSIVVYGPLVTTVTPNNALQACG
jgi:hypothetical protein